MELNVTIVERGPIVLIGREGYGDSARGSQWIQPLWQDLQTHICEAAQVVKHKADGRPAGLWGAMSDAARRYLPWENDGLYLAGFEADENASTPSGWNRWILPAFRYAVVQCTPQTYGVIFQQMIIHYLPEHGWNLEGAVQEYYPDDRMELYFPIAKL